MKIRHSFIFFLAIIVLSVPFTKAFADLPSSTNYKIVDYSFGGGGTASSSSTTYSLFGALGETGQGSESSELYSIGDGLVFTIGAHVPPAPTFSNPSNYYNKLKLVLDTGGNPSDAQYAIAISTDGFASDTRYVQSDNTIGATLGPEDWQPYVGWGGASGITLLGLLPGTTYTVKVAATRGIYSQTEYGPTAVASTINSTLSFDIDVASTDTETSPPYTVNIGSLTAATVTTASNKVWIDLTTNASNGGMVYVYGTNTGLKSTTANYTITSSSTNLTSATEGYGVISNTTSESSGGPIEAVAPYNGSSNTVGVIDTAKRVIFDSSNTPVVSGRAAFDIKAKSSAVTPAGADYSDIMTIIASANY